MNVLVTETCFPSPPFFNKGMNALDTMFFSVTYDGIISATDVNSFVCHTHTHTHTHVTVASRSGRNSPGCRHVRSNLA